MCTVKSDKQNPGARPARPWHDQGSESLGPSPVEALRTAKHLNEAYQKYLQMVRVWNKSTRRPWANAAETEVRGCNTAACDVSSSLYTL